IPLDALHEVYDGKVQVEWQRGYVGDITTDYNKVVTGQDLSESRSAAQLLADAVSAAREADVVLYIGGLNKSAGQDNEGTDRADIVLPYGQDALIEALAEVSAKLVVVNISGSPVAMPWAERVNAIVQGWYGGSESGHALVDVLTGVVNPSGKLPFTMPLALSDGPLKTERQYPGVKEEGKQWWQEYYDEGVFVGYRWYDTRRIPVQYPFGHGLSYTRFKYSDASVKKAGDGWKVQLTLTNTGSVAGAEVVQLYISDREASVERPAKELKGFQKVYLQPSESRKLSFTIGPEDLSFFDAARHAWVAEPGAFEALVGSSSADIRARLEFKL
ncbi:MAG: glycoside hydrolase family 3 C-terminal domain-containing protein, partial [Bacteroidales bacterium]|nr:glycoside hydrolase family 3 C-terminal domain-containing protein [Bacteroidales bacterium]